MKDSATAAAVVPDRRLPGLAYLELTKPRVSVLVALTAGAGFYLGSDHPLQAALLGWVLLATGLLAGGSACLNQLLENRPDSLMERTAGRPIPSARVGRGQAAAFGIALICAGTWLMLLHANALATLLGLLTSVIYLFAYTPLKRRSVLCTTVGAVPGGIPPLIGWAAATGHLNAQAWALFLILFLWQYPHFLAIAWLYRDDYRRGGFKMLPVNASGRKVAVQVAVFSLILLLSSLLPFSLGLSGPTYLAGALVLGAAMTGVSLGLLKNPSLTAARGVLRASLVYLPLLLILLMVDKVGG